MRPLLCNMQPHHQTVLSILRSVNVNTFLPHILFVQSFAKLNLHASATFRTAIAMRPGMHSLQNGKQFERLLIDYKDEKY